MLNAQTSDCDADGLLDGMPLALGLRAAAVAPKELRSSAVCCFPKLRPCIFKAGGLHLYGSGYMEAVRPGGGKNQQFQVFSSQKTKYLNTTIQKQRG